MPTTEVLLQNPYAVAPGAYEQAKSELLGAPRSQLERWARKERASDVALAWTHARALDGASWERLRDDPKHAGKTLGIDPRLRERHARIALASARCVRGLSRLEGSSRLMHGVRHDAWAACFGRTLTHGLLLERVVRDHDVLIVGETGTGKELVAGAVAQGAPCDLTLEGPPFAEINAAAVPDTLVESELFGFVKGAFTGASQTRAGLVRTADGGALFLDEVGDLPAQTQVKLLRVIETDHVQPLGSDRVHRVDVRFVAATHRDLAAVVAVGGFRADLYQRLAGVVIRTPALRERPEDIALIGERFVAQALAAVDGIDPAPIVRWLRSPAARRYAWPGNVRELRNVLRNLLLGLPAGVAGGSQGESASEVGSLPPRLVHGDATLAEVERWYIERAVSRSEGNLAQAARSLGIDRTTVARKLR